MKKVESKSKPKVKKVKKPKKYIQGEITFPIYVFNDKRERTVKIKTKDSVTYMGLHLGTVLTCVRDGTLYKGHYFSYNKST